MNYEVLKQLRKNHPNKPTQADLAKTLGVSRAIYGKKEQGNNPITAKDIDGFINYYGPQVIFQLFGLEDLEQSLKTRKPPEEGKEEGMETLMKDMMRLVTKLESKIEMQEQIIKSLKADTEDSSLNP